MPSKNLTLATVTLLLAVVVIGCSGPLELTYRPSTVAEQLQTGTPTASILVEDIVDKRGNEPLTKIGKISTTVADINRTELILAKAPAATVREAFIDELRASGYTVLSGPKSDLSQVEYVLSGELRTFSLDIASRDEVDIELYVELKEIKTGTVSWSGLLHETGDRYAGAMGNTRKSINRYLSNTIASVVRSAITAAAPALHGNLATSLPGSPEPSTIAVTAPDSGPKKGPVKGDSTLSVESVPPGAKVYIDEVYWGITPLTINFYPGIYELRLTKRNYRSETDKIGLKRGRTTVYRSELTKTGAD